MNSTQNIEPANVRGGLICDEMGMGKSIMILSLILISPPVGFTYPLGTSDISSESIVSSRTNPGDLNSSQDVSRSSPCITTLIVCPKSVIPHWMEQVEKHIKPGVLRVKKYMGKNRAKVINELDQNKIDILLVSYETLASDYNDYEVGSKNTEIIFGAVPRKKRRKITCSIFSNTRRFHRIILDEFHHIRTAMTLKCTSCLMIDAEFKFGLSGSPFPNNPEDMLTSFQFLGVVSNANIFTKRVVEPIRNNDDAGFALLRSILSHFVLHRKKDEITIPEKTVQVHPIKFQKSSVHFKIYSVLYESARCAFVAIRTAGDKNVCAPIFETIVRLRQAW